MKSIFILLISLLSFQIFAHSNPQRRICLEKNGQFSVSTLGQDEVALCQLGASSISAMDLVYASQNILTESVLNYSQRQTLCHGSVIQLFTADSSLRDFCLYADSSFIDLHTLQSGRDSGQNEEINSALGL